MENIDIVKVISDAGISLQEGGDLLKACCPLHRLADGSPEKTPSFTVYPHTNSWYCFGCSMGGDAITFVMSFYGLDYKSALSKLGIESSIFSPNRLREKLEKKIDKPDEFIGLWIQVNKLLYIRNLSLTQLAAQVDKILYMPDDQKIYALQQVRDSLL